MAKKKIDRYAMTDARVEEIKTAATPPPPRPTPTAPARGAPPSTTTATPPATAALPTTTTTTTTTTSAAAVVAAAESKAAGGGGGGGGDTRTAVAVAKTGSITFQKVPAWNSSSNHSQNHIGAPEIRGTLARHGGINYLLRFGNVKVTKGIHQLGPEQHITFLYTSFDKKTYREYHAYVSFPTWEVTRTSYFDLPKT
jgi:hypothetical protein